MGIYLADGASEDHEFAEASPSQVLDPGSPAYEKKMAERLARRIQRDSEGHASPTTPKAMFDQRLGYIMPPGEDYAAIAGRFEDDGAIQALVRRANAARIPTEAEIKAEETKKMVKEMEKLGEVAFDTEMRFSQI